MHKFRHKILLMFSYFLPLLISIATINRPTNGQFVSDAPVSVRGNPNYDGRALNIPLDLDGTLELYQHWMDQAFSGMFAAVANQKMSKTSEGVREEMGRCSKQVKDVISHANCVSKLLKGEFENKKAATFKTKNSPMKRKSRLELYKTKAQKNYGIKNLDKIPSKMSKKLLALNYGTKFADEDMQKHRRMRRKSSRKNAKFFVKTAPKYFLQERSAQMSPLGAVAQLLTKSIMAAKNKTEMAEWQNTVEKIRQNSKRRKAMRKEKMGPEKELMKLQQQIAGNGQNNAAEAFPFGEMDEILERGNRTEIRQIIRQAQRQKAARHSGKKGKMDPDKLVQLVRQGVTLGFALAGQNTTGWDEKTMRLVSPRFLSVVAEEEMAPDNETLSLLSPSLFSMHDDGNGIEKVASLPSLFRALNLRDQQQWLNLIMEAAGINEQAKKMADETDKEENEVGNKIVPTIGAGSGTKQLNLTEIWKKSRGMYEKEIRGEDGQPLYFTRENVTERYGEYETRKIDLWEQFMGTFSDNQKFELNRTGFVPMRPEQLRMVYGAESPFNDTEALQRLSPLNETQIREGMERDIHNIARLKQWRLQYHPRDEFHSRRRRAVVLSPIVSSPFVLAAPALSQAVVLSPVVLSPVVLTPAVFGPFILSPWVFVPVILSPRLLSPFAVNPWIFSPIILSPLVLHPLIVAPGIFNPIVLSPLLLSPLILAPQVFTPVILSPLVLNPLILTPMVGSPLVLSPFVLSPLILSPQAS